MPEAYRNQITKTFRDNAIRSVLLIDDEYSPYSELAYSQSELIETLKKVSEEADEIVVPADASEADATIGQLKESISRLKELTDTTSDKFKQTMVAENFVKFFHEQKCICDVEKQTQNLNPEKVRKSDLIILDYCLTGDDATNSLQLLYDLSNSKHLNLVVVYTNKPLHEVWMEIATTLRGSKRLKPNEFFSQDSLQKWKEYEDSYNEAWTPLSRTQQISYILDGEGGLPDGIKEQFSSDIQGLDEYDDDDNIQPTDEIVSYLAEQDIRKLNILSNEGDLSLVHGDDGLWIQCGEVFIALCEKHSGGTEEITRQPEVVWTRLGEALHSWYPCFYRVVLSELQNRIEDSNFSMSKSLGRSEYESVALLWSILKEEPEKQLQVSEGMLRLLLDDVSRELLLRDDRATPNFIKDVANNVAHAPIEFVKKDKKNPEPYKVFMKSSIEVARSNFKNSAMPFDKEYCLKVAHALNERTTTLSELPLFITTGTILKSPRKGNTEFRWFMCVTPSCDTIPAQLTGDNAQQLNPHRLLTFAKLEEVTLEEALGNAFHSSYIFVSDGETRLAFNVVNSFSKQPDLVKFVIVNHNEGRLCEDGKKALKLKNDKEGIKTEEQELIPVAQLEAHYAARYQAVQSHHEGRIGVNFVTAEFD